MIWVIPMAGKGSRTQSLGEFKPFIEIKGHKILSWFISSVKHLIKPENKIVFITTDYFAQKYNFANEVRKIIEDHQLHNKLHFINSPKTPLGVSSTVYLAKSIINTIQPVMVIFPDQYIDFQIPEIQDNSAYLGICIQLSDRYGFVKIKNGLITKFVEKKNISNIASAGVYITSSGKDFVYALEKQFEFEKPSEEHFLGPAFNFLIKKNIPVYPIKVIAKYDLGNIDDIVYFSQFRLNRDGPLP